MGQKLHRKRRYYRRRKSLLLPILGWVLAAAILIPGSFFAAKWLGSRGEDIPAASPDTGSTSASASDTGSTMTTTVPPASVTEDTVYRGFYLPYTKLKDAAALDATLQDAAAAGFNCVVVELKNRDGNTYYVSETEIGKTATAATADALSLKDLTDVFAKMRAADITPIPLLYAFEDAVAPRTIAGAKVTTAGHADWTWYDGDPQNGGKPWLNPYADAAQAYIVSLAEELQIAGAGAIMLDGVYFPTQTSQADFTAAGDATLSKGQVLQQFITRMDTVCDIPVMLSCTANAALGNSTAGYDIPPASLGAAVLVADLRQTSLGERFAVEEEMLTVSATSMGDTVARIMSAFKTRLSLSSFAPTPTPAAVLSGDIWAQQAALGKDASYFVYDAGGSYDFVPVTPAQ